MLGRHGVLRWCPQRSHAGHAPRRAAAASTAACSSHPRRRVDLTPSQLYDIEIDRINKPYLPLAAGDFSPATGRWLVAATGAASLAIGWAAGSPPLLATLGGSLLLGIAYSTDLPLLRWKRSPVLAACCILAVRCVCCVAAPGREQGTRLVGTGPLPLGGAVRAWPPAMP